MAKFSFNRPEPDCESQVLSRHCPLVSPSPSWPSLLYFIYLCLSLRFHSQLSLKPVVQRIQGTQSSCCFLGLMWEGEFLNMFRGRRVWSGVADDPGGGQVWHFSNTGSPPREKAALLGFFLISDYTEGSG